MTVKTVLLCTLLTLMGSCIGIDIVEDPQVPERIEISKSQIGLLVGDTTTASAQFFDAIGQLQNVQIEWESDQPAIASVNNEGLITAIAVGQANLVAMVGSTTSMGVLVTVVASDLEVANVTISIASGNQLAIGGSATVNAMTTSASGAPVSAVSVEWFTSDAAIVSISFNGVVNGLSAGAAQIYAVADGVQSNMLTVTVGAMQREGTFQGSSGYSATGSTILSINSDGELILTLSNDFSTDFALGTYIYLSNSTSGSVTRNEGLEIAEITTGGAHTFNVSAINSNTGLQNYSHVIILCKPASLTFGFAKLN